MRSPFRAFRMLKRAVTLPLGVALDVAAAFKDAVMEADRERTRERRPAPEPEVAVAEPEEAAPEPPRPATTPLPIAGGAPDLGIEDIPHEPTEVAAAEARALDDEADELGEPELYFNRELSWLDFNERVLELAEDGRVPLLERANFIAIFESNLDEFFMVRVSGVHEQLSAKLDSRGADGMAPEEVLDAIRERVIELRARLGKAFEHDLLAALAEHDIRVISLDQATDEEHDQATKLFNDDVFAALTPLVIGRGRPFPYISNLSLSLAVLLRNPEKGDEVFARVKVPKELLRRFLPLEDGTTFIPLEELIAGHLDQLFPGMEIVDHSLFRVTRDTDFDVSDEADDLLRAVEEEVRRRRFGEVVRIEVDADMSPRLREQLVAAMQIEERQVYEVEGRLGLDDAGDLAGVSGFGELRYPPWSGVTPPPLQARGEADDVDFFAAMRAGDILVHHPYDSFSNSVSRFVRQAVEDPDVLAIKQTVYRTSADSPLVPALIEATERGKQAVCLVELKARFDESANIGWAKDLEEAGVHVVYGIPGFKTHVKCVLVSRREKEGVRNYVHIGTGNYNPKTARLYTDLGLFTADPDIGADIGEMFNYLTGYARPAGYRKVLVAPFNLRQRIVEEIERVTEAHSESNPARIRMKMNGLLDAPTIRALYRASQAGVEVDINVRGICALRPGVEGVSENITVTSILGRFLEHSRIFSFEQGDERRMFVGSADMMPRNLYHRVELISPIEAPELQDQLTDVLDRAAADCTGAWSLSADGKWARKQCDGDKRSIQDELMAHHAQIAKRPITAAADSA